MNQLPNLKKATIQIDNLNKQPPQLIIFDKNQWSYLQKCYNLTPRERQIMELMFQGYKDEDTAMNMKIKVGTLKTHLRNVCRKVRARNRMMVLLKFINDVQKYSDSIIDSQRYGVP